MISSVKPSPQSSPLTGMLDFLGISLLVGLSSAIVLAGIVLLLSFAS